MAESHAPVEVVLRIPGTWSHPKELIESLPAGYRLTPEALLMPDGTKVEFNPMPPDDQFADIFRSSCRQPPTDAELEKVDGYGQRLLERKGRFARNGPEDDGSRRGDRASRRGGRVHR
jgi:hypothetical protein